MHILCNIFMPVFLVLSVNPSLGIDLFAVEGLAYFDEASDYIRGKCYTYWQMQSCWPGIRGGAGPSISNFALWRGMELQPPSPPRVVKGD